MNKISEQKAILRHIDELNDRIARIDSFMEQNPSCENEEGMKNKRTFEVAIDNLKKRVPIRPISKDKISTFHPLHCICQICPSCGNELINPEIESYCVKCGQALEWDEMED